MKKENEFNIEFPIIKNIPARLLADDIKGMTTEETKEAMKKMFDKFEAETGYKPTVIGNTQPTDVLIPDENKKGKK